MDIYEALEKMTDCFDRLAEYLGPDATDEELAEIGIIEDVIYQFVQRNEPEEEM